MKYKNPKYHTYMCIESITHKKQNPNPQMWSVLGCQNKTVSKYTTIEKSDNIIITWV